MAEALGKDEKKEKIREILRKLHQGATVEEAKELFNREVGEISFMEIAEIEQSLIKEGVSVDEIKKFCNVHMLIFNEALDKLSKNKEKSPAHPVYLFKLENREIEKITKALREAATSASAGAKAAVKDLLSRLRGVEVHYTRKEQVLFPYLEKYGFFGPSKVMWGKDDEIRDMLKSCFEALDRVETESDFAGFCAKHLMPLLDEVDGMILKEENILFPISIEKLSINDWIEVLKESDNEGYVFIEKPQETAHLVDELKRSVSEEAKIGDGKISFPSGELDLKELLWIFNTLPVDVTFIDKEDKVKYFSETKERIFLRTRSVIGRNVQNCHPPKSVDIVMDIVNSFKNGKRDHVDFWINYKERLVYIRYFAVRDKLGRYLGTLEVTQDITDIKNLSGEKRLLSPVS